MALRITPLEIKQKKFRRQLLNGLDADEVSAFLTSLAQAWDRLILEHEDLNRKMDDLSSKYQQVVQENAKLIAKQEHVTEAIELARKHASMLEKDAQQRAEELTRKSQEAADFKLREARSRAEGLISEAEEKSAQLVNDANEQASTIFSELRTRAAELNADYENVYKNRLAMIEEIKRLGVGILQTVDKDLTAKLLQSLPQPQLLGTGSAAPAANGTNPQPATQPQRGPAATQRPAATPRATAPAPNGGEKPRPANAPQAARPATSAQPAPAQPRVEPRKPMQQDAPPQRSAEASPTSQPGLPLKTTQQDQPTAPLKEQPAPQQRPAYNTESNRIQPEPSVQQDDDRSFFDTL